MATYKELQAQINALTEKAEAARAAELEAVLADIRARVAEYGLTPEDVFGRRLRAPRGSREKPQSKVAPKYRDPASGVTWSGRGRAPMWIQGKKRERFLIKD